MSQPADPRTHVRRPRLLRIAGARPRLLSCLTLALLVGFVQPHDWRLSTRLLIAWNVGVWSYLAFALAMMRSATHQSMRRRAAVQDEGRFALLTLASIAAIAATAAIFAQLVDVKDMHGTLKALHIGLASATIVSAWLFVHLIFALHYAHEFFMERTMRGDGSPELRGGLTFPGATTPDYFDFLYFSYIIGVASQTADVAICSRTMRHVSLAHSIVSFFFNTTILALTINIAAGLV